MKRILAIVLTFAMMFGMSLSAFADNLVADGDGLMPISGNTLDFGSVAAGSSKTGSVLLAIKRNGNYSTSNVFLKNSKVSVSIQSNDINFVAKMSSDAIISIPSNWDGIGNNALTDTVSSTVTLSIPSGTAAGGPYKGTITYVASGKDAGGKDLNITGTLIITYSVVVPADNTPPVLSMPNDITAEATSAAGAVVTFTATANDAVDGAVAVTSSPASGSTFPLGDTTVTCTAKDAHGNTATKAFIVTVQDKTAPVISGVPDDIAVEADALGGSNVTYTMPTASDAVDGSVSVSATKASGSLFPVGTTTVTFIATDKAGNEATTSFKVTVNDTTPPVISGVPSDIVAEATSGDGAVVTFASPTASDLVDGTVSVTCTPASGSTFALGDTTVTCTAKDVHGNTATKAFTVTVQDTTAPTLTLPTNITTFATSAAGAVVAFSATASDLIDGDVSVSCSPSSGSTFAIGTTTVNCTAKDAHGNTVAGSFTVTVKYNFAGFFRPVDMGDVVNTVKAGSAIPVKFSLGGNMGLNIFASGHPRLFEYNVKTDVVTAPIELTVTAGNSSLSYDPITQQYTYVWKTDKSWVGLGKQLVIQFNDGTDPVVAHFQFK